MNHFLHIIILLVVLTAGACLRTYAQVFALEEYLRLVKEHHPFAKQNRILNDQAQAFLLMARGGFDPKLYGEWEQKSFDGKTYFNIGEGGLKIPTWFGIEGKVAYSYTNGVFLNPENKLPANGQAMLGVTMPLLQGFLIDQRRTTLFQAEILQAANENERRLRMNDLMFEAAKVYWEWALAYEWLQIYKKALEVARIRFEGIKESYLQGDKPAIDTLEAFIQVQDRTLQLNDAGIFLQNAALSLQNFIWENEKPLQIAPTRTPAKLNETTGLPPFPAAPLQEMAATHPEVLQYDFKLQELEVERRFKIEQFKPKLDISYNLLGHGASFRPAEPGGNPGDIFRQNYKLGAAFSFPLFLRKERGSLQLTDLKRMETNLNLSRKRLEVQNKIAIYQNDLDNLRRQIMLASQMRDNYQRLLEAENEKFTIGESSLFLINARETKLIEAELKLQKLLAEQRKTEAGLRWAAGRLE